MARPHLKFVARLLSFFLGFGLLIKARSVFAQEDDWVGFRREFYQENFNRMTVNTATAGFDVGLTPNTRLQGSFVSDGISGATPTGAPPQSQWPYPTFQYYYNKDYNQLFQAAINNPNNLILLPYFPNYQAYTNFVAAHNPQLGTQATNNAAAAYNFQTNNPNIHNKNVPLTHLQDHRYAFSLALPVTFQNNVITPQASYSTESDYRSLGMSLNYQKLLNQKNTTLEGGWSHDFDMVRDDTLVHWQAKNTDQFMVGVNQLLTPKSYVTANFTYGAERGYLSDPYRGVMPEGNPNFLQLNPSDAALIPENRPRSRNEEILYTSYTQFIDPLNGSLEVGYRFYHDSYGIFGNTGEIDWHQKVGPHIVITPSFRYYYQTAADFYYVLVPDYNGLPPYYSSDYRLSEMNTFNFGITASYFVGKNVSVEVSYSRYIMRGLDGITSQSAYPSANVGSIGFRIWF